MCASHGKGNTFIDWYNKGDGLVFFLFNELHPYSVLLLKIRCRYTVYFVYTTGLTSQLIYKISFEVFWTFSLKDVNTIIAKL